MSEDSKWYNTSKSKVQKGTVSWILIHTAAATVPPVRCVRYHTESCRAAGWGDNTIQDIHTVNLSIFCKQRIINKVKLDQIQKPPTSETLEAGYYQCNTISQT